MRTLKSISIVSAALLLGFFAGVLWRPNPVHAQKVGYLSTITVLKMQEGKNEHLPVTGEIVGFACNDAGCYAAIR